MKMKMFVLLFFMIYAGGCGHVPKFKKLGQDGFGHSLSKSATPGFYSGKVVVSTMSSKSQGMDYARRALGETCLENGKKYFLPLVDDVTNDTPSGTVYYVGGICAEKNEMMGVGLRVDEKGLISKVLTKTGDIAVGDNVMTVEGSPLNRAHFFDLLIYKAAFNKRNESVQLDIGRGETFRRIDMPFIKMFDVLLGPADLELLRQEIP